MTDESRLKAYQSVVESRLEQLLPSPSLPPTVLHEAMRYSVLAPGKRIRPALAMASAEAVGGDPSVALDAGCAAELIHCFSLIHDDLPCIDNDDLRRGVPTCHKKFGEPMALLAGDALFALAFDVASNASMPDAKARQVVVCLAKATGSQGLVGGEVMDILAERTTPQKSQLQEIHRRKTGALISASCVIGGISAGAADEQLKTLAEFGNKLGLAFQVADDLLNEVGSERLTGKAVGSDRARGKATYSSLLGISGAQAEARAFAFDALAALDGIDRDTSSLRSLTRMCTERDC